LSTNRALASRRVLIENGLKLSRISHLTGKAATEPMIKEDPNNARNRRISIVLLREAGQKAKDIKAAKTGAAGKPAEAEANPSFKRDWSGPRLK